MVNRRNCLGLLASAAMAALSPPARSQARPVIEVWKDPNCGCCKEWIRHLKDNGISAVVHDTGNAPARARLGIAEALGSCHTGLIGGYAIEGHVPAREIRRLLSEKPAAVGLAVPGMPVGSPGMDGAIYRGRRDAYDVLLVLRDGRTRVFKRYHRG